MTGTTYNEWTNRETWLVNLWLTNDAETLDAAQAVVSADDMMLQEAAAALEEFVDELLDCGDSAGFRRDMIDCALVRVNWAEIVESLRAE